jgi:hypothetical protein
VDGGPSVTRRRDGKVPALALLLTVIVLLAIPVLVITVARGGLPLLGLLASAILIAPIAWLLLFGRH